MTPPITVTIALSADQIEALAERVADILAKDRAQNATRECWLTVDQAADYLGCRRQRIYNLVSQRRLRHRKDGSRVLFRRHWLDELLEASS